MHRSFSRGSNNDLPDTAWGRALWTGAMAARQTPAVDRRRSGSAGCLLLAGVATFPEIRHNKRRFSGATPAGRALGWKLSGAGGRGYLILVADRPIEPSVRIVVRREGE